MALLDLIQNIFSAPKAQPDTEVQAQEFSGLSGVERYLAKQALAAKEKAEAEAAAAEQQLTGVEKYLQKLASAEKAEAEPEVEAEAAAPLTGVEKYLAKQKGGAVKEKAAVAAPAAPAPVTGVDKYLAKKGTASHNPIVISNPATTAEPAAPKAAAKQAEPAPKETVTAAAKPAPASKETAAASKKSTAAAKEASSKPSAPHAEAKEEAKPKTGSIVKLSENATQCQARTAKGTQCKNTTHLTHIHRTINKQQYEFSVCTQHHNTSFKPYPGLIEGV